MNKEELELLRRTVRDIAEKHQKDLSPPEKGKFSDAVISEFASAGILGARISPSYGGSGLPFDGYLVILNELAKYSPSLSVRVMIANSIFNSLAEKLDNPGYALTGISEGKINAAVEFSLSQNSTNGNSLVISGSRIRGDSKHLLNADCDVAFFSLGNDMVFVRSGISGSQNSERLGLNSLQYSSVKVDSESFEIIEGGGKRVLKDIQDSLDPEIAAISLGVAEAALSRAVEYADQREAFGNKLRNYQPIAGRLARLSFDVRYMGAITFSGITFELGEMLALKMHALSVAEEATNTAIQTFGGYGYFEDFLVERYYRDIIAIQSLFVNRRQDLERVSGMLFGEKSGYL